MLSSRIPRPVRVAIALGVLGFVFAATAVERRRIEASALQPSGQPGASRVDGDRLVRDVETLASAPFEGRAPGTAGSHRARQWIVGRFRELGLSPVRGGYEQTFSFTHHSIKGLMTPGKHYTNDYPDAANLLGMIEGTAERDRFTVVSAHYDHVGVVDGVLYPGADDNASGVAVMLAAAEYFSQHRPRRSIVFAAFDAEEKGLAGAHYFIEHPPIDLARVAVDVNVDMIGRGDRNELYVAGTAQTPALRAPVEAAARGRNLKVLFGHDRPAYLSGRVESWVQSSDHGAFADQGIPFLYFGVEDHADVHKPTDTADRIPRRFFVEAASLVVDVVAALDGSR
jgi:hypothetical protein